ncbi:hypothetical protein C458_01670 [Haloferax sp. ATCC BAA-644]|nr:hypothetical protein C458_01670 [Haloferax sp. ATCC BAA-644]
MVCNEKPHQMYRFFMQCLWNLPKVSFRDVLHCRFDCVLRSDSGFRGIAFLDDLLVEIEDELDRRIRDIGSHNCDSLALANSRFFLAASLAVLISLSGRF